MENDFFTLFEAAFPDSRLPAEVRIAALAVVLAMILHSMVRFKKADATVKAQADLGHNSIRGQWTGGVLLIVLLAIVAYLRLTYPGGM